MVLCVCVCLSVLWDVCTQSTLFTNFVNLMVKVTSIPRVNWILGHTKITDLQVPYQMSPSTSTYTRQLPQHNGDSLVHLIHHSLGPETKCSLICITSIDNHLFVRANQFFFSAVDYIARSGVFLLHLTCDWHQYPPMACRDCYDLPSSSSAVRVLLRPSLVTVLQSLVFPGSCMTAPGSVLRVMCVNHP